MQYLKMLATPLAGLAIGAALVLGILSYSRILMSLNAYIGAIRLPPTVRVLFGGDMMFDRSIRQRIERHGASYVFSCLDPVLSRQDLVVANLEGPITENASVSAGSIVGDAPNFVFTFPIDTAWNLRAHHVGVVNIGNNHIRNFGDSGVVSTIKALTGAGVRYFGDPIAANVATTSLNGIALAFVNFNQFEPSPFGESEESTTIRQIRAARAVGELPIVYTHWGDEYQGTTELERRLAHDFVDAGAESVIGSHPHVVQQHEEYKGKYIYYSLGNLIFDQYWNDDVRHGLMVQFTISHLGVAAVREIPVELRTDGRTCPQ